jgi:hypothetical protein
MSSLPLEHAADPTPSAGASADALPWWLQVRRHAVSLLPRWSIWLVMAVVGASLMSTYVLVVNDAVHRAGTWRDRVTNTPPGPVQALAQPTRSTQEAWASTSSMSR